jgi:outer membrane murein-binding lipoprotein Lpp
VIEIYAAVLGASIGVAGLSASGFSRRNNESREAVIRLTMAVESIAGKLEELHQDMKADRKEIYTRLNAHGERITVLENKLGFV